ncbi:MAG TPA: hypothetical protein VHR66_02630 [Gemmataceae bacterium]|jgi:hypothetical protein|nr:hypothetical protein [Gemmataceae bacterium]
MRFFVNLIDLCASLPWWGALAVIGGLVSFFYLSGAWFKWKFNRIVHEGILEAGAALRGAEVTIHAVKAVPAPEGPSPYDVHEGDEDFVEGLDGEPWNEDEGGHFYQIEATIAPVDSSAEWDPSALAVVPADFEPEDPTDVCEQLGGLHSAEVFNKGMWLPLAEGEIRGPRRLRMLFAVPEGVESVKFASLVTYFGRVELPAPLSASRC